MGEEIKDTIKTMVIKRNGSSEPFSSNKIEKAILRAMRNSGVYKPKLAKLIASDAEDKFMKKSETREWQECVIYQQYKELNTLGEYIEIPEKHRKIFVREKQDFLNKFTLCLDL